MNTLRILKLSTMVVLFALSTQMTYAQSQTEAMPTEKKMKAKDEKGGKPGNPAKAMTKKMTKELDLSTDQATAIEKIFKGHLDARKDTDKSKEARKDLTQKLLSDIKSILNADQWTKFESKKDEILGKLKERKKEKQNKN